ncbi:sortase [Candidatus Microgenomates bacterium]|nr:sortase [Candidatus Microgenomates bacterium]
MTISGVIYDYQVSPLHGEIVITIPAPTWVRKLGIGLMVAGLASILMLIYPIVSAEINFRLSNLFTKTSAAEITNTPVDDEKEFARNMAQQWNITNTAFYIYIPKINAKAPIIRDVNASVPATYQEALKMGVAQAAGSSVPDSDGGTYLFAHSASAPWDIAHYNAVFYALNSINVDDHDIVYVFYQDKLYKYQIMEKHIVESKDTSWLTQASLGAKRLLLQTCWPPGTSWKNLILVAYPIAS